MHGYGAAVRELMAIFYADDAILASRDPVALQKALDIIVELFERVGLRTNTSKTKVMTCVLGKIRTRLSREAYNNGRSSASTVTYVTWISPLAHYPAISRQSTTFFAQR